MSNLTLKIIRKSTVSSETGRLRSLHKSITIKDEKSSQVLVTKNKFELEDTRQEPFHTRRLEDSH